jgi:hypothetical protein
MKKILMVLLLVTVSIGMTTGASASLVFEDVSPVSFYVVDDNSDPSPDGDDSVTLSGFGVLETQWSLEWLDDGSWTTITDLATGITIDTGTDDWELVYLRIVKGGETDDTADLTFYNPEGGLWNTVRIDWDEDGTWYTEFSLFGAGDDDNVAPIPIPTSALLFCSGLIGLIGFGFRRRAGS